MNGNYRKQLDELISTWSASGRIPTLLLHCCCAPCSSAVLEYLSNYCRITVFFYNPNISPKEEYEKRLQEEKRFIKEFTQRAGGFVPDAVSGEGNRDSRGGIIDTAEDVLFSAGSGNLSERYPVEDVISSEGSGSLSGRYPIEILEAAYDPERFFEEARGLESAPEGGERCTKCFSLRLRETARAAKEGGFDFFTTTLTISPLKDAHRLNAIGTQMGELFGVPFLPSDFKKRDGYKRSIELSRDYNLYRQNYCGCIFSKR